jgi:hypothetical protein
MTLQLALQNNKPDTYSDLYTALFIFIIYYYNLIFIL